MEGWGRDCLPLLLVLDFCRLKVVVRKEWIAAVEKAIDQGWSREEVAERISFLGRYPMNPGREAFGLELQRINAMRVYDELMARRGR